MEQTPASLIRTLLSKNNYRIDFEELKFQLLSHPSYPSLYAITSALDHLGIENLALEVPNDLETLQQLPQSFLSIANGHEVVLVEKLNSSLKIVFQGSKKSKIMEYQDFLKIWNGMIVGVEEREKEGIDDKVVLKNISWFFLLISAITPVFLFVLSLPHQFQLLHFFAGLVGLSISIMIFRHELGSYSGILNRFCSVNNATSCDAILQSKGATVLGLFKLSDACVVYFSATTITWFIYAISGYYGVVFRFLSIMTLPVVIYSIYYQYNVVKKWCPLCLGISGVLLVQAFSILLQDDGRAFTYDFMEILIFLLCALVVISFWTFGKPLLMVRQKYAELKMEHQKFKRNFDLFQAAHDRSTPYLTRLPDFNDKEIVLGNPNAKISLLLITNPLCSYCKSAHSELETILNRHPNDIRLTVRFNIPVNDITNVGFKVANRLNQLFSTERHSNRFMKAIDEAFDDDAKLESWLGRWGENNDLNLYKALLEVQKQWCIDNQVHFTPALILNGKEYPNEYQRMDLVYFIDDLLSTELSSHAENHEEPLQLAINN
ncbi:MAG: vitamin K epoxide reductase family protein [Croceivirga sp.]